MLRQISPTLRNRVVVKQFTPPAIIAYKSVDVAASDLVGVNVNRPATPGAPADSVP